jgi:hypothetical protein
MPKEWTVENIPSDEAARALLAAFIAMACRETPTLKPRLTLFLGSQSMRSTDSEARKAFGDALQWIQRLELEGTL